MGIADWSYKSRYEKLIPSWLHQLSDRQFKIFLDEVVLGDGSKASGGGAAFCVYGKENFLSSLQALCTVHGYRAHLKMRTRNGVPSFPVLNVLRKATSKVEGQRVTTEDYDGQVYCLTLPSSNFFVRHNGRVHLTGNCRIEKWIVDQTLRHSRDAEFLRQFLSPHVLLKLDERGILFHRLGVEHLPGLPKGWIKLGKCFFTHELSGSKNAAFNSLQKTAGNVVFAHCFSEDTEVLTPEGWVQLLDLQAGDTVGTLRLSDAGFEWQDNSEVVIYDHYDELVAIKNKNVDILVTPDHAMLTMSRKSVSLREGQSRTTLRKEKARDLLERSAFTMPLSAVNTNARFEDLTDDELRFFAWMLTEGCISVANKKYRSVRLAQSDCPTGGMVELDALLARMGIKHTKLLKYAADSTEHGQHRNYNNYNYNISSSNEVIEKFIRYCPGKLMGAWVLQLSADQFDVFIDTLITADGSYNKSATRSAQYATNSNVNADIFQAACSINGRRTVAKLRYDARRPHAKPVWCITVNELGLAHIHLDSSFVGKVKYEGRVACCTVPNGTLLLRRNGKVFAAGNTHREDSATIVFPGVGLVKAWNPGCLCQRQPLWRHSDPTSWSQGYATQLVAKSEEFLHLNIPIWDGKSLMGNLINRMKG
ncbi:MAG: hypothetical protein E6R03_16105 [Hyphomicrobiaceae bacterium]|nr:MAG: hypothetical protein E6R03_16105 [Hyphomicrobiaceae bacterium]